MDRRKFFGAAFGAALVAPALAKAAPLTNLCREVPLAPSVSSLTLKMPPPLKLLRSLYLAPGSFTTPRHHHAAEYLEAVGYLERTAEDGRGVYWKLTQDGLRAAAAHVAKFPEGHVTVLLSLDPRRAA